MKRLLKFKNTKRNAVGLSDVQQETTETGKKDVEESSITEKDKGDKSYKAENEMD